MRFCILTEIDPSTKHGMGKYIELIKPVLNISNSEIFNVLTLDSDQIEKINQFDICLVHIGLLKSSYNILSELKSIKIPKVTTIHSVISEEYKYFKELFEVYFKNKVEIVDTFDVIDQQNYQNVIDQYDALIFNTNSDKELFLKSYNFNGPIATIIPPLEHLFKPHSTQINKTDHMTYMARIDYRKGVIATLNAFEFLPNYSLDVYGLLMSKHDKIILEHFLHKNKNIKYKGLVQDRSKYFNQYSIFFGNSLYEPLGFSHLEHLFNYVTPIIGKNTGTSEVFGADYPFQVGDNVAELLAMVHKIKNTSTDQLYEIHKKHIDRIKINTNSKFKSKLKKLIYSL